MSFEDRGPGVLAVATATLVVASVFVAARLVSRVWIVQKVTSDDYFIVVGWVIAIGLCFAIDYGTVKGLGRHDVDIDAGSMTTVVKAEYAFTVLYNPALMATKTSILIFYLRLSRNTNKLLRVASYVTLGIVNIAGVVLTFLNIFQCSPIGEVFIPADTPYCIAPVALYLASAPVNIITDLAILVLPLPVLTGMRLPQKQKTILVLTFALGIFVTVVDVIRIYYLQKASSDVSADKTSSTGILAPNFAWYASISLMWTAVEVNIGIICACIPTLKPLIGRILPKLIDHNVNLTQASGGSIKSDTSPESDAVHDHHETVPRQLELSDVGGLSDVSGALDGPDLLDVGGALGPVAPVAPALIRTKTAEDEGEMGFLDFLAGPGPEESGLKRPYTARTNHSEKTVFFGFVNMSKPRSMLKTKGRESLKYCAAVTTLFFLWGFSYGLLNTLNGKIALIFQSDTNKSLGLQSSYFGAYFLGPLTVGQYVLRKGGFKATFITGLCIYGTGTLMFWPCAVLQSFPGFVLSQFVVGFGLSVLETAANPFLVLCGPPDYGEMRLLLAQSVQALGSVISPVLAERALFASFDTTGDTGSVNANISSLIDVQWTYLAIALFSVMLALFFFYMPLPEATDEDLILLCQPTVPFHNSRTQSFSPPKTYVGRFHIPFITLAFALVAQFMYVAAQESVSWWSTPLITLPLLVQNAPLPFTLSNYQLLSRSIFCIARFTAAGLCLVLRPRLILLGSFVGAVLFTILIVAVPTAGTEQTTAAVFLLMITFFFGPLFPLIFAIALSWMGRKTKYAAAGLVAAASGGALFPWVQYAVQTYDGLTIVSSFSVPLAVLIAGLSFPVYLLFYRPAQRLVDPRAYEERKLRKEPRKTSIVPGVGFDSEEPMDLEEEEPTSRRGSEVIASFGRALKGKGKAKAGVGGAEVEHRETGTGSWRSSEVS